MVKALIKVSYTVEGLKGLMKEGGSSRVKSVEGSIAALGGSLESFYFAFGSDDVYIIASLPDHATAIAMATTVATSGAVSSYETVVLLEPSEVDEAMNVSVAYTPPSG